MRIEDFRYLLEIDRCRSINQAAQNLFLSHSTLSYTLQNLEKELGYPIFKRTARGVVPTPRGAEILADCKTILEIVDRWFDSASGTRMVKGHVQITAIPIFAHILGLDRILSLKKIHPALTIRLEERALFTIDALRLQLSKSSSRLFVGSLSDPELAIFKHLFQADPSKEFLCYSGDELALHISADHPYARRASLYPEELRTLPLLFYPDSEGNFGYSGILRFFPSTQAYGISTAELVLDMVAQNLSVALASRLATSDSDAVKSGAVRAVSIQTFPMPMNYYVLYPSEADATPQERIVIRELSGYFDSLEAASPILHKA